MRLWHQVPVIFEGDFWVEEAVRLARQVDRKDDVAEDSQTPLEICRFVLAVLFNVLCCGQRHATTMTSHLMHCLARDAWTWGIATQCVEQHASA